MTRVESFDRPFLSKKKYFFLSEVRNNDHNHENDLRKLKMTAHDKFKSEGRLLAPLGFPKCASAEQREGV